MTKKTEIDGPEAPLDCPLCPRLVSFRADLSIEHPDWFNAPVPSFGDPSAELLIVGLAPGKTGANRTGRPFTGDWAGDLLYATIQEFGLCEGEYAARPDDGLRLTRTMITNAVRCVPPENKPVGVEIKACRPYLTARLKSLPQLKAIITLGKISHDSTVRALGLKVSQHVFAHAAEFELAETVLCKPVRLISSYHCSRYNTNTGRLTPDMFRDVFQKAKAAIDA